MQKLSKIKPVFLIFVLVLFGCGQISQQPNIVIFLVDDLGWNETSIPLGESATFYNHRYNTPNLERLASQGMVFTNARAHAICVPSRVSLLTGQSPMRHGVSGDIDPTTNTRNTIEIPAGRAFTDTTNMLPALLKKKGYYTIHSGKFHICHWCPDQISPSPQKSGFDVNIGGSHFGAPGSYYAQDNFSRNDTSYFGKRQVPGLESYYGTETHLTEALTIESLKEVKRSINNKTPFFLYQAHFAVHTPIQPHNPYLQNYQAGDSISPKENAYASMVEGVDASLGQILDSLEAWDVDKNTLFVFYSDNGGRVLGRNQDAHYGDWAYNHPLRSGKASLYEGGLKVPAVVRWPGTIKASTTNNAPIVIEDLYKTILNAAGTSPSPSHQVDGLDLNETFKSHESSKLKDRFMYFYMPYRFDGRDFNGREFSNGGVQTSSTVIHKDWKLLYFHEKEIFELYHLANDVGEKKNLVNINPDQARRLVDSLDNRMRTLKVIHPIRLPERTPVSWPLEAWNKQYHPDTSAVYKSPNDGSKLRFHIFKEETNRTNNPAVVFFFGGGWRGGTPKQFYAHAEYFKKLGFVAISAEYRTKSSHGTTANSCVEDGKSAIRWVRENAKFLGIDPNKIVSAGGSSGGHVAASTAMILGYEELDKDGVISSIPNALILFNPVINTSSIGYGSKYLADDSLHLSPHHNVKKGCPPTLIFHGTGDKVVPFQNVEIFAQKMMKLSNDCLVIPFEGKGHGFFNDTTFRSKNDPEDFKKTMKESSKFLKRLGFIP